MSDSKQYKLRVDSGGILDVPVWEKHERGKNWLARIQSNPEAPGGLAREFARFGRGDFYFLVEPWMVRGTPVEFGADYYTGTGRKNPKRSYGVLEEVTPAKIVYRECNTARGALEEARRLKEHTEARANEMADERFYRPCRGCGANELQDQNHENGCKEAERQERERQEAERQERERSSQRQTDEPGSCSSRMR